MRIVKLSPNPLTGFATLDDVRRFFRTDIRQSEPPGKFRVTPGRIGQDGLEPGEPLIFTYQARVVYTARAGSGLVPNEDEERGKYSSYFLVDLATLREADKDLRELEQEYSKATGASHNLVETQGWNQLADSPQAQDLWVGLGGSSAADSSLRAKEPNQTCSNAILLQRLCWNSNGWRGPTGDRYRKEDSYVGQNGFGHEEWNLNTADLIDGKVYGYTYYKPPVNPTRPLGPYDIYFFAITPTKKRVLVGAYRKASFLDQEERKQLKKRLEGSAYLVRRAEELVALGLPHLQSEEDAMRTLLSDFALNVCTAPEQVVTFSPSRLLRSADIGGRDPRDLKRYTKPLFVDSAPVGEMTQPAAAATLPGEAEFDLLEDAYVRFTPAQRRVINRRHNVLSNRFRAWLDAIGATEIVAECVRVDVTCAYSGESYLFELKTCYKLSTRHALREALGQVLEYALYPGRSSRDRLAIVLDAVPSVTEIEWFRRLVTIGVAVELYWLIGEGVYAAGATDSLLAKNAPRLPD